ncbi:MAG: ABC transporter substrate-binding protein [Pseudolabrys sp.]
MRLIRLATPLLLGTALTFAMGLSRPAHAEGPQHRLHCPDDRGFAQVGKDMVDGFQLYLDETNSDFAGAKVKLIVEDDQAKPDLGVTKAKKLILSDKVQMFVGGVLASTAMRWRRSVPAKRPSISPQFRRPTI